MTKKSMRLLPVRQLKQQAEQQEAKKLAHLQRELEAARQQCHELENYLAEYFSSIQSQQAAISRASQLGAYQAFITRLQEAIRRQGEVINQHQAAVQAQTQKWIQANAKLKTMDQLIEKARQQEDLEDSRREQKQMDELPFRGRRY